MSFNILALGREVFLVYAEKEWPCTLVQVQWYVYAVLGADVRCP